MDPIYWVLLSALAIVVFVLGMLFGWSLHRKEHARRLRNRFGPEYDHLIQKTGDQLRAEQELLRREERVKLLDIRPLSPEDRARFAEAWRVVQTRFADTPAHAVAEADELVAEVMRLRGYPMGDFQQRAADISVDHPRVVENYRMAHALAMRSKRAESDTEELRQAMLHYRALFAELLESSATDGTEARTDKLAGMGRMVFSV